MRDTTLPPVRVTAEFKARLARYAESQERDVSWVIRKAVEDYLARHGSEDDQR
jgi:predicted transcriptional regulator